MLFVQLKKAEIEKRLIAIISHKSKVSNDIDAIKAKIPMVLSAEHGCLQRNKSIKGKHVDKTDNTSRRKYGTLPIKSKCLSTGVNDPLNQGVLYAEKQHS